MYVFEYFIRLILSAYVLCNEAMQHGLAVMQHKYLVDELQMFALVVFLLA